MDNKLTTSEVIEALVSPIAEAMSSHGITPDKLARKLSEELEAHEQKVFLSDSRVKYSKKLIAWKIRQEARKDAHKLLGHYPTERHDVNVSGVLGLQEALDAAETTPYKPKGEDD
jgi:hypothetical protein